jgi:hypothetical protein
VQVAVGDEGVRAPALPRAPAAPDAVDVHVHGRSHAEVHHAVHTLKGDMHPRKR